MKVISDEKEKPKKYSFYRLHMIKWIKKDLVRVGNNQTISGEQYEIIWIEYYSRVAKGIKERIEKADAAGKEPPVDKWLVMGTPDNVYYHKHLMYNIGIIASKGANRGKGISCSLLCKT